MQCSHATAEKEKEKKNQRMRFRHILLFQAEGRDLRYTISTDSLVHLLAQSICQIDLEIPKDLSINEVHRRAEPG